MRTKKVSVPKKKVSFLKVVGITGLILLVPFIAMQFSPDVNWSVTDFIFAGVLILTTGLMFDLTIKKVKNKYQCIALGAIIFMVFLLVWIELAVGIFGTPFAGN